MEEKESIEGQRD